MNASQSVARVRSNALSVALSRAPALRPLLVRMARRAASGQLQPETFSASGLDYADQGELERLLGIALRRGRNGRVCGSLPPALREPSAWRDVLPVLGVLPAAPIESVETFWARLRLLAPKEESLLSRLSAMPEVDRFVRRPENRASWQRLFLCVVGELREAFPAPTTLSQLGSRWFNDSKSLRTGPLRNQLALILSESCGRDIDERALFGTFGIFDNPYTSGVTLFAPFTFVTEDYQTFDFPWRLYAAGHACMLPSETVSRIRGVCWKGPGRLLTTSENAAPFACHVAARNPTLYTEGYPNLAVQRLLTLFAKVGIEAEHEGDADLDGFRIAAMVGRCLPLRRVIAAEVIRHNECPAGIPLTEAQRNRLATSLAISPTQPYANELRLLLERNCWYEQESFPRAR